MCLCMCVTAEEAARWSEHFTVGGTTWSAVVRKSLWPLSDVEETAGRVSVCLWVGQGVKPQKECVGAIKSG